MATFDIEKMAQAMALLQLAQDGEPTIKVHNENPRGMREYSLICTVCNPRYMSATYAPHTQRVTRLTLNHWAFTDGLNDVRLELYKGACPDCGALHIAFGAVAIQESSR